MTPNKGPNSDVMPTTPRKDLLSVITPAFQEEDNLPLLYERLKKVLVKMPVDWEWIIVDDHSPDTTYEIAKKLASSDPRIKCIRLAKNSGSHIALACGIDCADGDLAVLMASDLQDPPELIPKLYEPWQAGAQVVAAVRAKREGEAVSTLFFAKLFYWLIRNIFRLSWIPETGSDFMLIDRRVVRAVRKINQKNSSVFMLITWLGFRQKSVLYDKHERKHGSSNWTMGQKFKLALDTLLSFSYLPIRLMSLLGIAFALSGLVYALFIISVVANGSPVQGWASLMIAILFVGGMNMFLLGILGEYLWRTYEEAKNQPNYFIEDDTFD
jgi:polyisoprenyl-phosphate glycosyltransferase